MNKRSIAAGALALTATAAGVFASASADAAGPSKSFTMKRSPGIVASACLPHAKAAVTLRHVGEVEKLRIVATGLPKNTDFDAFVIQVPNFPFGVSWYQGDLETDETGTASVEYAGRFSEETFAIAPGVAPAPVRHSSPTPDASSNPAFGPVHTYHLGIWFNSPADAVKAGCSGVTTPFNGEHNAGVQVLNTANFPDLDGPLGRFRP